MTRAPTGPTRPVGARRREDLLPGRRQLDWQHRDQGHSDRRPLRTRRRVPRFSTTRSADAVNGDPLDKSVFPDTLDAAGGANTSEDYYCIHVLSAADLAVAGSDDFENKACITAKDTATNPVDVKDAAGDTESCDTVIVKIYDPKMAVDKTQALDDTGANWTDSTCRRTSARRSTTRSSPARLATPRSRSQRPTSPADPAPVPRLYDSLADAVNGDPLASLTSRTRSTAAAGATRPRTTTASTPSAPPTWPAGSDGFVNKACITAKDTATNPVDVKDAAGETESCDTVIVKIYDPKMKVTKTQTLKRRLEPELRPADRGPRRRQDLLQGRRELRGQHVDRGQGDGHQVRQQRNDRVEALRLARRCQGRTRRYRGGHGHARRPRAFA